MTYDTNLAKYNTGLANSQVLLRTTRYYKRLSAKSLPVIKAPEIITKRTFYFFLSLSLAWACFPNFNFIYIVMNCYWLSVGLLAPYGAIVICTIFIYVSHLFFIDI